MLAPFTLISSVFTVVSDIDLRLWYPRLNNFRQPALDFIFFNQLCLAADLLERSFHWFGCIDQWSFCVFLTPIYSFVRLVNAEGPVSFHFLVLFWNLCAILVLRLVFWLFSVHKCISYGNSLIWNQLAKERNLLLIDTCCA